VLAGQALHTFQFKHQRVFHEGVGKVFPHRVALVSYRKGSFVRYRCSSAFIGG